MPRNKHEKRKYQITINFDATTTNGFMVSVFDDIVAAMLASMKSFERNHAQSRVEIDFAKSVVKGEEYENEHGKIEKFFEKF